MVAVSHEGIRELLQVLSLSPAIYQVHAEALIALYDKEQYSKEDHYKFIPDEATI